MAFGSHAAYYVANGWARYIDQDEAQSVETARRRGISLDKLKQ
jgi:hypothetical protein